MNHPTEKKSASSVEKKTGTVESTATVGGADPEFPGSSAEQPADTLREAIAVLDAERTDLVKTTIENLKPGKPFDPTVIRAINKIETRKNRLIIARFAFLLRKNGPQVQALVHQLIEL